MRAARYWLTAILPDAAIIGLFYAWQVVGLEQAANVVVFWLWFVAVTRSIVGIAADKTLFAKNPRPAGFDLYHGITEFVTVSALVWFGFFWLGAIYLISALLMEGVRNREPKKVAADAGVGN